MPHNLTLHMLVKNEAARLRKLLPHVAPYVDEMSIAVDDLTSDDTAEVCRPFTDKVIQVPLNWDFASARNPSLDMVKTQWVLHLDADEWPMTELLDYIVRWIQGPQSRGKAGLVVWRHNLVGGKPINGNTWERHVRVFWFSYRFVGRIHEQLDNFPITRLAVAPRAFFIQHYKTNEEQGAQNKHYQEWPEQRAITGE